jgi:hypothetical protein
MMSLHSKPHAALAIAFLSALACGGAASPGTTNPSQSTGGSFAGTYSTRVTLTQNNCGSINVQDNPTTVTHDATLGTVRFTHAGQTYTGTVKADSTFSTPSRAVNVNDGFTYNIGLTGRFRPNAFDADATVDRVDASNATCRFVVHWVGMKS